MRRTSAGRSDATAPHDLAAAARSAAGRLVATDAARGATAALPALRAAARRFPDPFATGGAYRWDGDRLAALAELYEVMGWILFDAGRHGPARWANHRALALARLSGDRWTERLVLLNDSMLMSHLGRPRAALEDAARVPGARRLPALVDSLVLIRRAHAVAALGGEREAVRLVSRAESRFLDGASANDPPWAWWIDHDEVLGHRGWVMARLGRWDEALPLLHRASTAPGPSYRRLFTAHLLASLARAGAWREAERLADDLVPGVPAIGSARTLGTLRTTTAALLRGDGRPPVALREAAGRLRQALPAAGVRTPGGRNA
ncbi:MULTISPECIES: tetratricopeptide repeat protein [Streptomyces]|nr:MULTISPECIES: DNA-binding protein [Streptomyces]MBC2878666.1 DNA-binding protein [Streptomyces sp. TYQ1024]UBI35112.1 DNA-binding protein [Streptomyces mobaraensis]UKW27706.1 DNA-binding protein [Streptomyces sp. TYQ1024]